MYSAVDIKRFRGALREADNSQMWDLTQKAWHIQVTENDILREYVRLLNRPTIIQSVADITYLPISFFKTHKVVTGRWESEHCFQSSGTGSQVRSRHYIDSLDDYEARTASCFRHFYGNDPVIHLCFLPFYESNPQSSLISMMKGFVKKGLSGSKFYDNLKSLNDSLTNLILNRRGEKIFVWTVSYGLLDFADQFPGEYPEVTFIETGGMKGTRSEMPKWALHDYARKRLTGASIHSEYGMCELSSQAYALDQGKFSCPPGLCFHLGDPQDQLSPLSQGRRGIINVIDLHNIHSCCFIQTEDLGQRSDQHQIEIIGRMDIAEMRGCNLLYG